jgi:hypothetical protein
MQDIQARRRFAYAPDWRALLIWAIAISAFSLGGFALLPSGIGQLPN